VSPDHVGVTLLAQLLDEAHRDHPTPSAAWRSAIFLGACQLIALKFGDPELTPDELARELGYRAARWHGCSRPTTRRLCEAAHRSVTDIAFACGFNDVSHFGRMFAARMHMTPSRWRRRRP